MKRFKIYFLLFGLILFVKTNIWAQDVTTMLNTIGSVFNNRQEALYDEAESYLNALSQDSIEINLETEVLFHINKAFLYELKYKDWEKSTKELDYILSKIEPVKHMPEYSDPYKMLLSSYGYSLLNSGQKDRAVSFFNKILVEGFDDDLDIRLYNTYYVLANIYDEQNNYALSKDCHNKCQEFIIKTYIRKHPEYSFYLDNYKTLKYSISQLEKQNKNNTEEYVNTLCSLGYLLHKVDQGEYWEAMIILLKARKCAIDNNHLKARGLEECYVSLQDIFIKYIPEPTKTEFIEDLLPYLVDYYSGVLTVEDIYESIASSYGANQQYEMSIKYELKALDLIEKGKNKERLKKIYQCLVMDYLGCSSDSTNQAAFEYLRKFGKLISEKETNYYEWYLENKGALLRYLYKKNEAIQCFNNNLSYYTRKYGKESNQYISTLNQLALCYPFESETFLSYLLEAKSLINKIKDPNESTLRGICINLARNYILTGKPQEAKIELDKAATIEKKIFGKLLPLTQELINQCVENE